MRFLIPSYKRCGHVTTLHMLRGYGVQDSDVTISVQTYEDHETYAAAYPGVRIVCRPAHNAAGNRNTLLDTLSEGESAVLMDDDLRRIDKVVLLSDGKAVLAPLDEAGFFSMLDEGFSRALLWGVQHIDNRVILAASAKKPFMRNVMLEGSFMGCVGGCVRFDEGFDIGEDYEACANAIERGLDTARLTRYCVRKHAPNGVAHGGCHEFYELGTEYRRACLQRIVKRYRGMVAFSSKKEDCTSLKMAVRI